MNLELVHQTPAKPKAGVPPILFLHGAWHGAWCWQTHFMPYFAEQGYETYAMSLRGHGNSPSDAPINTYSLQDYIDDLTSIVAQIGRPPIIIAHSMGGFILQKFLEKQSCAGGILMAPLPPHGVLRFSVRLLFTKRYALPNLARFNLKGLVKNTRRTRWAFFSEDVPEELVAQYTAKMVGESFKAFLAFLFPKVSVNYHTKIPLMVLGATNDNIFTVKDNQRTAKKYNATLSIMEEVAHDMMLDTKHQEVAQVIMKWLDKNFSN
ncbi:MAG TPA: alpha/beta hydrolase [Microscillaceae bacterium]|nr:alpha/beta hydrolase [Microscillaceae bacterium]